jgi:broad specificity phosphatase PhoE
MSEKEPNLENVGHIENKDISPKGREIDFYLFRHAEASGEGLDSELTERGKEQATQAAQNLLEQVIKNGGGVIKFLSSPIRRAKVTSEIMQHTIRETLAKQQIKDVRLMSPRDRDALRAAGVIGPLKKRGINDPIDYWLNNPDALDGKSPAETAQKLQGMINFLQKISDRLPAGEKIYYIGVTHEVPQAAFLHEVSGQTLNELGGNIQNCESIKIELVGKSDKGAIIKFRNEEMKTGNPKD